MAQAHLRSLYRSILRELPARPISAPPSPLKSRIRDSFVAPATESAPDHALRQRQQAEQFVQYIRAQSTYIALLERYNPGLTLDDEDRIRLSARRVGMNMPVEFKQEKK